MMMMKTSRHLRLFVDRVSRNNLVASWRWLLSVLCRHIETAAPDMPPPNSVQRVRSRGMRGSAVRWLSIFLLLVSAAGKAQDLSELRNGVVKISSTSVEGKRRTGTGFIVKLEANGARIVTAAHVVEGDKNPMVEFFTLPDTAFRGKVYKIDFQTDVAVISVQGTRDLPSGLRALRLDPEPSLTVGQDVHTIGFPPSLSWAISKPNYASRDGLRLALIGGNIDEGNSGGPVLKDGAVVAMITAAERGSGRAVPASVLGEMLKGWRINLADGAVTSSAPKPPAPDMPAAQPSSPVETGPQSAPDATVPSETFRDCPDCPEMVVVPAGRFRMGSPATEAGRNRNEGDRHEVVIPAPFAVGKYEITRGQFSEFVRATGHEMSKGCWAFNSRATAWLRDSGRSWLEPGFTQTDQHPVVCVSWEDARAYVKWLSGKTGKHYRLLTEAEWEYATRANTVTARYWRDPVQQACEFANVADQQAKRQYPGWSAFDCDDRFAETAPVGSYKPNGFGLHDMLGNVWEWVEDCWNESYAGAPNDGSAWLSGNCTKRVLRGGSWSNTSEILRSAFRNGHVTANRNYFNNGFRIAMTLR